VLRDAELEAAWREYNSRWTIHPEGQGSVLFTAYGLADAYSQRAVRAATARADFHPEMLFGERPGTLFIVAPESEVDRLAPLLTALIAAVVHSAESRASAIGGPLEPRLPHLLTTARGNGVQLLLIYHDLAQLENTLGRSAARTVVSNAKLRMLLPGVGDLDTLRYFSDMLGRANVRRTSTTTGAGGHRSTSVGDANEELAPLHVLQQLPAGQAVAQYQNLPPMRVRLRFFFKDKGLRRLADSTPGAGVA
jgi:type IV secretory pathway TraG/TraD family ATPase VirD4